MTVATTTNKAIATGNGLTTTFPFTFGTLPTGDLVVTLFDLDGIEIPQTEVTDYTVLGEGSEDGGAIVFLVAPTDGYTVLIQRIVPILQPTDYKNQGSFYPRTHERSFDRSAMIDQQLFERVDAAMTLPPQVTGVSTTLPAPTPNTVFGWNETGDAVKNFELSSFATAIAYGNKNYQVFAGTGAQVNFTLSQNPGALGNLDVSIDGVTQVPVADYSYTGTTLTFTSAPDNGAVILVRFDIALPTGVTEAAAVNFDDAIAPAYLKTMSQMLNGDRISLMRFINPMQHSAIRDFTSTYDAGDDINNAFAAYKNFAMPAGLYRTSKTLLTQDRLTINGDGWSMAYSGGVQAPRGTVIKLLSGANCDVFRQANKAYRHSLMLRGFAIDGDGANQGNVGNTPDGTYGMYQFNRNAFFFEALYNAIFENVLAYNMRGAGWALHGDGGVGMTNLFLKYCHAYNCRTYSVYTEGNTTDMRIFGGDYGFGRVANLRLTSSCTVNDAVFWTSQCQDPTDAATHATGTGAVVNGGIIIAGDSNKISGCRSEGNAGHGIKIVGNDNDISDSALYFNSATASTSGLFDGINDAGDRNKFKDMEIRQSAGSPHTLRKAIKLEAAHSNTRIIGGDMTRVGANAAEVALPVQGLSFASSDKSDFSWGTGEVKASQSTLQALTTSFTKVQFRTEATDTRGEWSTTTDDFTAAETGIYRVDFSVAVAAADGNQAAAAIFKGGVEQRRFNTQRAGSAGTIQVSGSMEMKLEAGDVVDVRALANPGANSVVGGTVTWIEIVQING